MFIEEKVKTTREAVQQWEDGAITFVEMVFKLQTLIEQSDLDEHNAFLPVEAHIRFERDDSSRT